MVESQKTGDMMAKKPTKTDQLNLVKRSLIRLYKFLDENENFDELELLRDLEQDSPNEALRTELEQIKLQIETLHEENQLLRESALQCQIDAEDQVTAGELETWALKEKASQIEKEMKEKIAEVQKKAEEEIAELKKELRDALEKSEKLTEVNEAISLLQEKLKNEFDRNERIIAERKDTQKELEKLKEEHAVTLENLKKNEKKVAELEKKSELQKMVIDGYQRRG